MGVAEREEGRKKKGGNGMEGHGMLSVGRKFHPEMLTQPSIKNQTARQIANTPYLKVVGIGRRCP